VKALRKPSRIAWALNCGTAADRTTVDALTDAVSATLETQASGGDVRGALARLRGAVRDVAENAARASAEYGHPVEAGELGTAVLAVIASAESFQQLSSGYLSVIPEAGGLDFLSTLPMPPQRVEPKPSASPAARSKKKNDEADARRVEATRALAEAKAAAEAASKLLAGAESALDAAEERLRSAEEAVRAARTLRDRARADADTAAARVREAEAAAKA
jgi:hypothetical protein